VHTLRRCNEFNDANTLAGVFGVDDKMHNFTSQLPQASNRDDRILKTLDFLLGERFSYGTPVASFFPRALADAKGEGDSFRAELASLAEEVDNEMAD